MKLSSRDRAKVNAALVLIRDAGHDVGEVTSLASIGLNSGTPPRKAYERAFDKFVERVPSFRAPLQRLGQLIENTDDRTLARYNVGLSAFIETGERGHLEALLPTVQQDMAAMAEITGDAGFAEGLEQAAPPDTPTAPAPVPATTSTEALGASPNAARPGWGTQGFRPHSSAE